MTTLRLIIGSKNYSSWSLRPWLVLKQAQIPFEEIEIALDRPETRQQILRYSPSGLVPILQQGDQTIWDSLAICEYLAEQFPDRQLWPSDPAARAIARSVSAEMHSGFAPLRQNLPVDCRSRYPTPDAPGVQDNIDRIVSVWQQCRSQFGSAGDLLFGSFSIADAFYAPVVTRFLTYGVVLEPIAQRYCEVILQLPAMQEWYAAAARD